MIDRLAEMNRLLRAVGTLGHPSDRAPTDAVIRFCRETVIEGLLPDHEKTVEFVCRIGLATTEETDIALTSDGRTFMELNVEGAYELSDDQRRYLVRRHYFDGALRDACGMLLKAFSPGYVSGRFQWSSVDNAELPGDAWLVEHLCQLSVLERLPDGLQTSEPFTTMVSSFRDEPKGLTEEKLRQLLREKEEIGDIAEQLVSEFERVRLRTLGHAVESSCVRRIGKLRVNAGFDIESFDAASPTMTFNRFIEVKGAKSRDLHFFWSDNEMKVAGQLSDRYWIYFQGGIDPSVRRSSLRPLLFQNPMLTILSNNNVEKTSQGLIVQAKMRGDVI